MTLYEFAEYIAKKVESLVARRYGDTYLTVGGSDENPLIMIENKAFDLKQTIAVKAQYEDFNDHGQKDPEAYAEALVFEIEYALFEMLEINEELERYMDFETAAPLLYTKILDTERSQELLMRGVLGRKLDDHSMMVLFIHDENTKTFIDKPLVEAWGRHPSVLFIKASENMGQ